MQSAATSPSLSQLWDSTVPRQQVSLGAGLGLGVPPVAQLWGTSRILYPASTAASECSVLAGLAPGSGSCWSWRVGGRRCWGEPSGFSQFPFPSFLCFSLPLSCLSQPCVWTNSASIRCASASPGEERALQSCGRGPGRQNALMHQRAISV